MTRVSIPKRVVYTALAAHAALGVVAALVTGCGDEGEVTTKPPAAAPPAYTTSELLAAPLDLKFGGVTYEVAIELWRDFMPPVTTDGSPLGAGAWITAVGALGWPAEITTIYVYVVKDAEIWASKMERETGPTLPANERLYVAHDGPNWDTGIRVDVVIGLRTTNGTVHLVRTPGVLIQRLE